MNISIHLHGTPRGYVLYPSDGNDAEFRRHLFAQEGMETSFVIERRGALVHYSAVYHGLDAIDGEHHASLALTLTLNSVLCKKPKTLFRIMDDRLKRTLLFRGKVIATIEQDRVGFLSDQFDSYQADIEVLEKTLQQDLESKLLPSDWLSFRENVQGEALTTSPALLDWSLGEEMIVEKSYDTPFLVLQSSEVVDSLYASSALLRKRRRLRRIMVGAALVIGLLVGGFVTWQIKPNVPESALTLQTSPNTWSSDQATDLKAPHWAILEPLKGKKASYNVYFVRYADPEHWICEKHLLDFTFGETQEHKTENLDLEAELITRCNNIYSDITQKRIRVVVREGEFDHLHPSYKARMEELFGKIVSVPEEWIRDHTTKPWQIAYPIENRMLI